jgi:CrcB protein
MSLSVNAPPLLRNEPTHAAHHTWTAHEYEHARIADPAPRTHRFLPKVLFEVLFEGPDRPQGDGRFIDRPRADRTMWKLMLVALGGGVGTALRYGLGLGVLRWLGAYLPWGTLAANVLGSMLLGVVMEASGEREWLGVPLKLVVGTGVLGGFTTYSSFNLETLRLFEQGAWARGMGYLLATMLLCLAAGLGGVALARAVKA